MEITELLTQAGAAAFVILVLQIVKPALGLSAATWQRFGALIAVLLGVVSVNVANLAAASPLDVVSASFLGVMAGATASGLYQAGSRTAEAVTARLQSPTVEDYDPRHPGAQG